MKTPKIVIKGHAGSGKTTFAWVIKAALKAHGINCKVTGFEDEDPLQTEACWQERIKLLEGETVEIETIQLRRDEAL